MPVADLESGWDAAASVIARPDRRGAPRSPMTLSQEPGGLGAAARGDRITHGANRPRENGCRTGRARDAADATVCADGICHGSLHGRSSRPGNKRPSTREPPIERV